MTMSTIVHNHIISTLLGLGWGLVAAKAYRCDTKSDLERTWTIATDPTTTASQKSSWDQNILCALVAKSPCNAPAVPTLVKPVLSADTQAQVCTEATQRRCHCPLPLTVSLACTDRSTRSALSPLCRRSNNNFQN